MMALFEYIHRTSALRWGGASSFWNQPQITTPQPSCLETGPLALTIVVVLLLWLPGIMSSSDQVAPLTPVASTTATTSIIRTSASEIRGASVATRRACACTLRRATRTVGHVHLLVLVASASLLLLRRPSLDVRSDGTMRQQLRDAVQLSLHLLHGIHHGLLLEEGSCSFLLVVLDVLSHQAVHVRGSFLDGVGHTLDDLVHHLLTRDNFLLHQLDNARQLCSAGELLLVQVVNLFLVLPVQIVDQLLCHRQGHVPEGASGCRGGGSSSLLLLLHHGGGGSRITSCKQAQKGTVGRGGRP
mmetsp:Transcript_30693/g.45751  ORF Transcript_30693/g.45751 Transcript_30693/m.45751 type:complete len:300 (-) Transcript_30693:67-966(-)